MKKDSSTDKCKVFIDTMIFLHFKLFDEVNWQSLLKSKSVHIIILPVILNELDKHKDTHPIPKIRKRAKSVLKKLGELIEVNDKAIIRQDVTIEYKEDNLDIDYGAYQLDKNRRDDQQIGNILAYKSEYPNQRIVFVTDDLAATLRAKKRSIEVIEMPEEDRLPDELDANEKRIKELEKEILELKSLSPRLRLVFNNGSQQATFTLKKPPPLALTAIEEKVNEIKRTNPLMEEGENKPLKLSDKSDSEGGLNLDELSKFYDAYSMGEYALHDIRKYNSGLEEYYSEYRSYLIELFNYESAKHRTIELAIILENIGTAPAKDIDIHLHFPDGFELYNQIPEPPREPIQPKRPLTRMEKLIPKPLNFSELFGREYHSPIDILKEIGDPLSNVSKPTIRRTNSYDVSYSVRQIKHNKPEPFERLHLIFENFESTKSFSIEYRISAGNMPHELTGHLNVIIEKVDSKV